MKLKINDNCIKCGKCVKVCPSSIFSQKSKKDKVELENIEFCIKCGHCVYTCPEDAIEHSRFPQENLVDIDYSKYPSPEQLFEIIRGRRTNRAFSKEPIPQKKLDMILEAGRRAPTASNSKNVKLTLITDPKMIYKATEFTILKFTKILKLVNNPILKPILKPFFKDIYRYIPAFLRLVAEFEKGNDLILRGATALILIHAPKKSKFGIQDCNLAYQNASLMAEALDVTQMYTGFVCSAINQDGQKVLNKLFKIDGNIYAGMALAIPEFKYKKASR